MESLTSKIEQFISIEHIPNTFENVYTHEYGREGSSGSDYSRGFGCGECSEWCQLSGDSGFFDLSSGDHKCSGKMFIQYDYDIPMCNNKKVYVIDTINTIISNVKGNIAKGFIFKNDLTLIPCFICKENNTFAHGKTLHEAYKNLQAKLLLDRPIKERIVLFKEHFPEYNKTYPNKDLYNWHHILTGSCTLGRDFFAFNHNIDVENDSMTIKKFIKLTENSYGGNIIKKLKDSYESNLKDYLNEGM